MSLSNHDNRNHSTSHNPLRTQAHLFLPAVRRRKLFMFNLYLKAKKTDKIGTNMSKVRRATHAGSWYTGHGNFLTHFFTVQHLNQSFLTVEKNDWKIETKGKQVQLSIGENFPFCTLHRFIFHVKSSLKLEDYRLFFNWSWSKSLVSKKGNIIFPYG